MLEGTKVAQSLYTEEGAEPSGTALCGWINAICLARDDELRGVKRQSPAGRSHAQRTVCPNSCNIFNPSSEVRTRPEECLRHIGG